MIIPNGDQWTAEFLRSEPIDYTELGWLNAYAKVLSNCKPNLIAEELATITREAFERESHWNNPKIAAACDLVFGPSTVTRARR